jgi:hypothetical protein
VAGIAGASEGRLRFLLAREWRIGLGRGQAKARGGVGWWGGPRPAGGGGGGGGGGGWVGGGGGGGGGGSAWQEAPRCRWRAQATFHDGGADIAYGSARILDKQNRAPSVDAYSNILRSSRDYEKS